MRPQMLSLRSLLVCLAVPFTALAVWICWLNSQHYRDPGEFKHDLSSWSIIGGPGAVARNKLEELGYKCNAEQSVPGKKSKDSNVIMCYRELTDFPCDHRLQVWLSHDVKHQVDDIVIQQINGQLPTFCL